jgi:hypothetical protein
MISKDRQLEIAKECGFPHEVLHSEIFDGNSNSMGTVPFTDILDKYSKRIEAEVIASLVAVAMTLSPEADDKRPGVRFSINSWEMLENLPANTILYRLPDSKTEEEL